MGVEHFKSKVDLWIAVVLFTVALVCLEPIYLGLQSDNPEQIREGLTLIGSCGMSLLVLMFPMRYTVTEDTLRIRHGFFWRTIPLRDIVSVSPTRSWFTRWTNPALSLDQLLIRSETKRPVAISPKDRRGFVELVERRSPQLRYSEDRLGLCLREEGEASPDEH